MVWSHKSKHLFDASGMLKRLIQGPKHCTHHVEVCLMHLIPSSGIECRIRMLAVVPVNPYKSPDSQLPG